MVKDRSAKCKGELAQRQRLPIQVNSLLNYFDIAVL
jgi:hypothetical protein